MTTQHLLDPAAQDFVQNFPSYQPERQTLADYRRLVIETYTRRAPPKPLNREERTIPSPDGAPDVRVLLYRPEKSTPHMPAVIHLHGGGFVSGTAEMVGAESRAISDQHGALVVAVDYRLAPETPFPGPLDDCYAALDWVFRNAGPLGVDPARIVVMGGSAGGGLAAALALLARDRAEHALRAQVLIYPMLDSRTGTPEAPMDNAMTGEFVWTRETNRFGWEQMGGGRPIAPDKIGYYAPALAKDLSRLPETFIAVGALDLFLEENVDYALRLTRAGIPVEAHVYPGAPHGFRSVPGVLAEQVAADTRRALDRFLAHAAK
jgi:triacylglycerol lipase